jgi:hypothetical protein
MYLTSNFPEASALAILVVGFLLAKLVHHQTARLMQLADHLLSRHTTVESGISSPHLVQIGQTVAYWLVVILVSLLRCGCWSLHTTACFAVSRRLP